MPEFNYIIITTIIRISFLILLLNITMLSYRYQSTWIYIYTSLVITRYHFIFDICDSDIINVYITQISMYLDECHWNSIVLDMYYCVLLLILSITSLYNYAISKTRHFFNSRGCLSIRSGVMYYHIFFLSLHH